jgi:hypothetical protein
MKNNKTGLKNKALDQTNWKRVLETPQSTVDRESTTDQDNPDLSKNKFKKNNKSKKSI